MLILLISYTSTVLYYTGIFLGNEDWGCEKVMGVWNIEDRRAEVKRRRRESRGAVGAEGGGMWGGAGDQLISRSPVRSAVTYFSNV